MHPRADVMAPRVPVPGQIIAPTRPDLPVHHASSRNPGSPPVGGGLAERIAERFDRGYGPSPATGRLVVIGGDGSEGPSFPLVGEQVDIGRCEGAITLPEDKYMSPRHARLFLQNHKWVLRDLASTNGVYYRIREPHLLVDGDLLLLGGELLRFEAAMDAELAMGPAVEHGTLVFGSPALPRPARLVQRTVEGIARDVYYLHRLETVIGRETGDIVFTDDPYMSRKHAIIRRSTAQGPMTLVDLNSSNGSFVAIRGDCALSGGDSVRIGQHLFRVELAPA